MTEILVRRETEDEKLAMGATYFDDIDLVEVNGKLCVVSIKNGMRVCQRCGDGFNMAVPAKHGVDVMLYPGSPPIILHPGCANAPPKVFVDKLRGLLVRRNMAGVARASAGIAQAAVDAGKRIVGV